MEQTQTASQPVVDYHPRPSSGGGSWVNPRIAIFALVIFTLIGTLVYLYLDVAATGGIKRSGEAFQVDLKSMSTFSFDQRYGTIEDVPQRYRDLNGKSVILIGEMWAPDAAGAQVDHFDLVYSIQKCCFSGPPQVQHFVKSTSRLGMIPFYDGLVRVRGTLKVEVTKDSEGKITGIYHVAVEAVEPV